MSPAPSPPASRSRRPRDLTDVIAGVGLGLFAWGVYLRSPRDVPLVIGVLLLVVALLGAWRRQQ